MCHERSARSKNDDEVKVDVHVTSNWPKELERRSSGGMMIEGTLVEHGSKRGKRSERLTTANTVV